VLAAMEKQMRAEREKRAVILTSEGSRDAVLNAAEARSRRRSRPWKLASNSRSTKPKYRLESKKAIRRVKKIGNAHIFEAVVSRRAAQRRLIDELLDFFGGSSQPVVAHLIESGSLTLEDVKEAEQTLKKLRAEKSKARGGR
jgi:regulator of protease activity HflC (stomatin/prohibitin superfamily)